VTLENALAFCAGLILGWVLRGIGRALIAELRVMPRAS